MFLWLFGSGNFDITFEGSKGASTTVDIVPIGQCPIRILLIGIATLCGGGEWMVSSNYQSKCELFILTVKNEAQARPCQYYNYDESILLYYCTVTLYP